MSVCLWMWQFCFSVLLPFNHRTDMLFTLSAFKEQGKKTVAVNSVVALVFV